MDKTPEQALVRNASMAVDLLATAPKRQDRSLGLDVLRGIFALWVLFTHVILWSNLTQSPDFVLRILTNVSAFSIRVFQPSVELHPAVLGFIVLSGYCIHRGAFRASPSSVREYFIRRAFRILPIFIVASGFGIIGFAIVAVQSPALLEALTGTSSIDAGCIVAKLTTIAAFLSVFHPCSYAGNAPLLTVMTEITLYVAYAITFVLIWKGRGVYLEIFCNAAFFASLFVAYRALSHPNFYNWWQNSSFLGFVTYWWIGALFLNPKVEGFVRRWWLAGFLGWLTLTIFVMSIAPNAVLSELRKVLFCIVLGPIICWLDRMTVKRANPFSKIGLAGYSIYAFHAPVTYVLAINGVPWWISIAAAIIIGLIMFLLIERPMTTVGRQIAKSNTAKIVT